MTLIETTVAMVVLGAAIVAVAQLVAHISVQRLVAERDALAHEEAANHMEQLFALPWEKLSNESAAKMQLSDVCLQRLSSPELSVSVGPPDGKPVQRRMNVDVSWLDGSGHHRNHATLTAWRYEIGGAEE
jgi:hypothetical protein